jgi:DHA3 family tetracycline resistance protein-like MFS transporter
MRLLQPLRRRDFALLFAGSTISLIGDGVYTVALAFQVYALDNSPGALSLVLLAYSAGLVVCALVAGVVVDRVDRRAVIVVADALQLVAILAMGLLSVAGALQVWHCALLAVLVGAGTAFVKPAATALLPHVVPKDEIVAATSLEQSAQQASYALLGPALGGVLVGTAGPGTALVIDAATFAASIGAVSLLRTSARPPAREEPGDVIREIREGIAYVRGRQWLWGTLLAACIAVMCIEGPVEIALPYAIKNDWGSGAGTYGALLAVAGFAGIGASLVFGARGLPRRPVTAMMLLWVIGMLSIAGFGLVDGLAAAIPFALLLGIGTAGDTIWFALLQTRVPGELLGRVSSPDWMLSFALLPVSYALAARSRRRWVLASCSPWRRSRAPRWPSVCSSRCPACGTAPRTDRGVACWRCAPPSRSACTCRSSTTPAWSRMGCSTRSRRSRGPRRARASARSPSWTTSTRSRRWETAR